MVKRKPYQYILSWLPAVILMIIIFTFSSRVADDSNRTSVGLTKKVVYVIEHITNEKIEEGSDAYEQIHHIVRKTGHFLEYMALGCTFVLPYALLVRKKYKIFILSEISSVFYACTDEFHQLFVEGRDGNFKDVGIDGTGALIGVCVGLFMWYLIRCINKKTKKLS